MVGIGIDRYWYWVVLVLVGIGIGIGIGIGQYWYWYWRILVLVHETGRPIVPTIPLIGQKPSADWSVYPFHVLIPKLANTNTNTNTNTDQYQYRPIPIPTNTNTNQYQYHPIPPNTNTNTQYRYWYCYIPILRFLNLMSLVFVFFKHIWSWFCREFQALSFDNQKNFNHRDTEEEILKILRCSFFLEQPLDWSKLLMEFTSKSRFYSRIFRRNP